MTATTTTTTCEFCHVAFASRNLFFRHLRDAATACGGGASAAARMEVAPSTLRHQARQRAYAERTSRWKREYANNSNDNKQTEHCVWIGDLPLPWTRKTRQYQRLRALLRAVSTAHDEDDSVVPWILHVQRKAYKRDSVYLGYVVVAVRDAQECTELMAAVNGRTCQIQHVLGSREVSSNADFRAFATDPQHQAPFVLRARPYVQKEKDDDDQPRRSRYQGPTLASPDPPLVQQLRPLSTRALIAFTAWVKEKGRKDNDDTVDTSVAADCRHILTHPEALEAAVAMVASVGRDPRQFIACQSRATIPDKLRDRLLQLLSTLRWPVPNHRSRVVTERYMVLLTKSSTAAEATDCLPLREACRELVEWCCRVAGRPIFEYSAIAVTKNFVGSPHIDERDTTVQYAVSLGDFVGGELCVQGRTTLLDDPAPRDGDHAPPNAVYVINTHNRMACVDGRHVHWVRPWESNADRYSLIFYSTDPQHATPMHPLGCLLLPDDDNDDGHMEITGILECQACSS